MIGAYGVGLRAAVRTQEREQRSEIAPVGVEGIARQASVRGQIVEVTVDATIERRRRTRHRARCVGASAQPTFSSTRCRTASQIRSMRFQSSIFRPNASVT